MPIKDKEARREYHRRYNLEHIIKMRFYRNRSNQRLKERVLSYYSNGSKPKCLWCGENDPACLSIDHINGGGIKHLKEIGQGNLYRWLVKQDYPEGYQTLCMNCQFKKQAKERELLDKLKKEVGKDVGVSRT